MWVLEISKVGDSVASEQPVLPLGCVLCTDIQYSISFPCTLKSCSGVLDRETFTSFSTREQEKVLVFQNNLVILFTSKNRNIYTFFFFSSVWEKEPKSNSLFTIIPLTSKLSQSNLGSCKSLYKDGKNMQVNILIHKYHIQRSVLQIYLTSPRDLKKTLVLNKCY